MRLATALLLPALLVASLAGADGVMVRFDFPPFYFEHDLGGGTKEADRQIAIKYCKPMVETANYMLGVYGLKNTVFDDYAKLRDPDGKEFDRAIRIRLWRKNDDFLKDFQKRYETKSIPGAFYGTNRPKDEYGKHNGPWQREIGAYAEGLTDEQILRHLYHELGHLFMQGLILYNVEVPSWIEEGTAEFFQYRPGNGTKPEEEREERMAWLVEMIAEGSAIPWAEMIKVQNLDNLDFTWKDPMRSTIQYTQAWSMIEFVIGTEQRKAAFQKLLQKFKAEGERVSIEAGRAGLKGDAWIKKVRPALYPVQEAFFKECFGAELVKIEDVWKGWVTKAYEAQVKKRPILRYHRGAWHVEMRASRAKSPSERDAEIAKAEVIFKECLAESPDLPESHVGLGRVAMARGRMDQAMEHFAQAAAKGTDNFDALLYGSIAQIRSGQARDACVALDKAVQQRATHVEANYYLGQAIAIALFGEQLPELPKGKVPAVGKPVLLDRKGLTEKALLHLRRARDLKQQLTGQCSVYEAMAQYSAGQLGEAYISFLRAQNVDRENTLLPVLMAIVKCESNASDEALELLDPVAKAGNAMAAEFASLIKAGKPLPKPGFSKQGRLTLVGAGFRSADEDDEAPAPKSRPERKPAGAKPKDDSLFE